MSEHIQSKKDNIIHKRPDKLLRLIYAFLFLLVLSFVICRIFFYKTPQEQLAVIEKSLAIPDSENAAIIYNQLFENYNQSNLVPAFMTPNIDDLTRSEPWKSQDYPKVAKWLEENEDIFIKLIEASKYEHCLFPIAITSLEDLDNKMSYLSHVRQFAYWLIRSANNDFGEGRIDQALEKYICSIRMGRQFRQKPLTIDFLIGNALETLGLQKVRYIIMYDDATEEQIKTIETTLPDTKFKLEEHWKIMLQVEDLHARIIAKTTPTNFLDRLKELWLNRNIDEATMKIVKEIYLRLLTDRHGTQILVALRQYKNINGNWPEKLEEIKSYLSSEDILIDPQNNGSFVYKLQDNSFILYSTGLNGIDENGQYRPQPADDWSIWPLQAPQIQTKMASTKVYDPNME